jgi:UDP-GlcNAc3NAcA epimerase
MPVRNTDVSCWHALLTSGSNMKIATIVGARPQFIKTAILSRILQSRPDVNEFLIHTGQHYDRELSEVFFQDLMIREPAYNLGVGSGSHGEQTAEMLHGIERVLLTEKPDCVVVYGDTNSTLAGALAASKLNLLLVHVEAGMRSFNRQPEEINRVLTDHCSDLLFAPTTNAVENLRSEGIEKGVHLVGDLMYDAVLQYGRIAQVRSRVLQTLKLRANHYVLATVHRAENTDSAEQLQIIVDALKKVGHRIQVIFPIHPRTRNAALRFGISLQAPGLQAIDPIGYLDMMMLQKNARAIITDSGGVQKEAFFHKVPCVTVRRETEWTELLSSGWNRLAPPFNADTVVRGVEAALASSPDAGNHLFGKGYSAECMADIMLKHFTNADTPTASNFV